MMVFVEIFGAALLILTTLVSLLKTAGLSSSLQWIEPVDTVLPGGGQSNNFFRQG